MNPNQNKAPESNSVPAPTRRPEPAISMGVAIGIGAGIGTALGIVMGNLAVSIAIGVALGAGVGAALESLQQRRTEPPENVPRR